MNIATIDRNPLNSPQMQGNDAAIMRSVERELAAMGANVKNFDEKEDIGGVYDVVLHMSRTPETLRRLSCYEAEGRLVINSVQAVMNCSRVKFTHILQEEGIKQPPYRVIESAAQLQTAQYPAWIKRAEGWSCSKEDVAFVTTPQEAADAFKAIRAGGCPTAILCDHIAGDIIKFYGIGGGFFRYGYPDGEKTKFGLEKINGTPQKYPFDATLLQQTAFKAARAVGLSVFGGDAIITEERSIYIIDINDFPSFSAVREEAAKAMAQMIIEKRKHNIQ